MNDYTTPPEPTEYPEVRSRTGRLTGRRSGARMTEASEATYSGTEEED